MSEYYTKQDMYGERFYPVPKVFMTNPLYKKGLTPLEKLAYGILKDRFSLSQKNGWFDKQNRIYFIFTQENLMELFDCSKQTASNVKKNLIKVGLLEKKSWGQGKADWLYLKKPIVTDNDIYKIENGESLEALETSKNETSKSLENRRQEVSEIDANDTELSNTDLSDTEIKKIVNKKSLKAITDSFYPTYSIGRWSKKQWNVLIEKLANEIDVAIIKTTPQAYIKGCLNNIVYAHDFKHGKIEFDLEKHNGAVMFYNWLDDVEA